MSGPTRAHRLWEIGLFRKLTAESKAEAGDGSIGRSLTHLILAPIILTSKRSVTGRGLVITAQTNLSSHPNLAAGRSDWLARFGVCEVP
jgi:hypothetical protein